MIRPDRAIPRDWLPPVGVTTVWTIYDHPRDFPNHWVVAYDLIEGARVIREPYRWCCPSLDAARRVVQVNHPGATCLGRCQDDDPVIYESWL